MKRFIFLLAAAVMVCGSMWSCSRDDSPVIEEPEPAEVQLTAEEAVALCVSLGNVSRSSEEIKSEAYEVISFLDGNEATTKSSRRTLAGLSPVLGNSPQTKGGSVAKDTLAFIASFGDGAGYAVLSVDRRAEPVIFFCPEGNASDEVSEDIPSMEDFCQWTTRLISAQIEEAKAKEDSLLAGALAKMDIGIDDFTSCATKAKMPSRYEYRVTVSSRTGWVTDMQRGPYIKVRWGQQEPYNNNTPIGVDTNGISKHCVTGCGPTAVAQFLSYWEYPKSYNWAAMKKTTRISKDASDQAEACNQVAKLMRDLGDGMSVSYGVDNTVTDPNYLKDYLSKLGFNNVVSSGYRWASLLESIKAGKPVLTLGIADKKGVTKWSRPIEIDIEYQTYDIWVIDGYLKQNYATIRQIEWRDVRTEMANRTEFITIRSAENREMVHCNWGWDGLRDGWYADGLFEVVNGWKLLDDRSENCNLPFSKLDFHDIYCYYNLSPKASGGEKSKPDFKHETQLER